MNYFFSYKIKKIITGLKVLQCDYLNHKMTFRKLWVVDIDVLYTKFLSDLYEKIQVAFLYDTNVEYQVSCYCCNLFLSYADKSLTHTHTHSLAAKNVIFGFREPLKRVKLAKFLFGKINFKLIFCLPYIGKWKEKKFWQIKSFSIRGRKLSARNRIYFFYNILWYLCKCEKSPAFSRECNKKVFHP